MMALKCWYTSREIISGKLLINARASEVGHQLRGRADKHHILIADDSAPSLEMVQQCCNDERRARMNLHTNPAPKYHTSRRETRFVQLNFQFEKGARTWNTATAPAASSAIVHCHQLSSRLPPNPHVREISSRERLICPSRENEPAIFVSSQSHEKRRKKIPSDNERADGRLWIR